MNFWGLLKSETEVRLYGDVPPEAMAVRLSTVIAPRFSFRQPQRSKLLRGRVSLSDSLVRWPLTHYRIQSARILKFSLVEAERGTLLIGRFEVGGPLLYGVMAWLACGVTFWTVNVLRSLGHGHTLHLLRQALTFSFLGAAVGIAYLQFVVLVGKSRDKSLVRLLRVVLASAQGASVADELLAPDSKNGRFVDEQQSVLPTRTT